MTKPQEKDAQDVSWAAYINARIAADRAQHILDDTERLAAERLAAYLRLTRSGRPTTR